MNVRCSYCGHTFNLSREFMTQALAEATEKHHKSVSVECINCRKQIKVSTSQMRRFVPLPEVTDAEPEG